MNRYTASMKNPSIVEEPSTAARQPDAAESLLGRWRSVAPRLLRALGAGVLVASLSVFLFQNWDDTSDLGRFGLLLGQTALLMAAGFACARYMQEPKGARIFVAIALVAVVANFAVLGGLLWSRQATSSSWIVAATIAGLVVLWPISRIGFMVLARHSARSLIWVFFAGTAILLVPVRDAVPAALLAGTATAVTVWMSRRLLPRDPALRSPEGIFSLLLPLVPVGVIIGRGILFYSNAALLATTGAAVIHVVLREAALQCRDAGWRSFLEKVSAAVAVLIGIGVMAVAAETGWLAPGSLLPIGSVVTGSLLIELSWRSKHGADGNRLAGASVIALAMAANALLFDGLALAALALVVGIAVAVYGFVERQAWLLAPAAVAGLTGLGSLVCYAADRVEIGAWGILALVGISAVVAGSFIERVDFARCLGLWRAHSAD
ncbi:MAG: hypothetical protein L0H73_14900 [Nitrococcus sp.]|nr:hypothetical protein [Nitrococcus sp.]